MQLTRCSAFSPSSQILPRQLPLGQSSPMSIGVLGSEMLWKSPRDSAAISRNRQQKSVAFKFRCLTCREGPVEVVSKPLTTANWP